MLAALAADLHFGERDLLDMDLKRLSFWLHARAGLHELRQAAAER